MTFIWMVCSREVPQYEIAHRLSGKVEEQGNSQGTGYKREGLCLGKAAQQSGRKSPGSKIHKEQQQPGVFVAETELIQGQQMSGTKQFCGVCKVGRFSNLIIKIMFKTIRCEQFGASTLLKLAKVPVFCEEINNLKGPYREAISS